MDWNLILPTLLGTAAGGLITLGGVWIQARSSLKTQGAQLTADREARQDLRDIERDTRRVEFERENERTARDGRHVAHASLVHALAAQFEALQRIAETEEVSADVHRTTADVIEATVIASSFVETFSPVEASSLSSLVIMCERVNRNNGPLINFDLCIQAASLLEDLNNQLKHQIPRLRARGLP